MGHTDVVPVNPDGWTRDPFGGELVDGEVWGRGAVDMLNLTSSMAVAFRHLVRSGFRPRGDLIYVAVADEESGSKHGMQWMADHERDAVYADYVLTENGGLHSGPREEPWIGINVGEKGVAWRTLRVRGTPGHGSAPFKLEQRAAHRRGRHPTARRLPAGTALPRAVAHAGRHAGPRRRHACHLLLDPERIDAFLDALPVPGPGGAPARVHAHHVLVQHDRSRRAARRFGHAHEDQRDPRLRRHRGRHAHPARRGSRRRRRTPATPRSATCTTRWRSRS
jgi:hypothetical protein